MADMLALHDAAMAADAAWQRALVATYGKQACNARYDERGAATPELLALRDAKRKAGDERRAAWRADISAQICARRPEIGQLMRAGRLVYYVGSGATYQESDAPECLPMVRA